MVAVTRAVAVGLGFLGLAACQVDKLVTSPAPIFQSEETRALRAAYSGATLIGPWQTDQGSTCRSVNVYDPNGTYRSNVQCREGGGVGPALLAMEGSWNIREQQYCENFHRVMGQPATPGQRQTRCFPASVSGDTITSYGVTYRAIGNNRYQAM